MAGHKILLTGAVVAIAVMSALAIALVTWERNGETADGDSASTDPIAATGTLAPTTVLFGDTLRARVDVVVDKTVIDADGVQLTTAFGQWKPVHEPQESREDSGDTAYLRTTYVLRCLTRFCVPARETEQLDFEPAEVSYEALVGDGSQRLSLDVPWPRLVVHSRIGEGVDDRRDVLAAPWRADLVTLPLLAYRISPGLLLALLLSAGVALIALAGVLVYRAIPDRKPPPEPEPEPIPVATLLEQALAFLEAPATSNGAPERRRALELVADEVESWGDTRLATTARSLAWSEHAPESKTTKAFAAELRSRMESLNGNAG
ncbi:MAG: hypothetical protein H0U46_03250 [Actinobacteria bacterium]|nr:hypothetical protein [Actinomycetota bacterium]